jgi:hypothetical protein
MLNNWTLLRSLGRLVDPAQADYQSAAGYQPVVMSLRLTNGDENPA